MKTTNQFLFTLIFLLIFFSCKQQEQSLQTENNLTNSNNKNDKSSLKLLSNIDEGVTLYKDDGRCEIENIVARINQQSDCSKLNNSDRVWGIKANGTCRDVSDENAIAACEKYKNLGHTRDAIKLYHDDGQCNASKLIAQINQRTNCDSLKGLERVWGVEVNGECRDISDLEAPEACKKYQQLSPIRNGVKLFHDDGRCEMDNLVAQVNQRSDCSKLKGLDRVWGVQIGNSCVDISDLNAEVACEKYKFVGGKPNNAIALYKDDGICDNSKLLGYIRKKTNCDNLTNLDRVWGIKLNGQCLNISDDDAISVCKEFKPKLAPSKNAVALYKDDGRCSEDTLVAYISPETQCNSLSEMDRVWGIQHDGICRDVSDSTAVEACIKYKSLSLPAENSVDFYKDDGRCASNTLITRIGYYTNCEELSGMGRVWGIKAAGQCRDISDSNIVDACKKYKALTLP